MTESNKIKVKEQLNIRLVLDRSGSMSSCRETTVDSINKYIHEKYDIFGSTALYDAIGTAVHDLSIFNNSENEKKVLVIVTDDLENASQEYTSESIKKLIEEKTREGWLIVYLGADHDAFTQSRVLGFERTRTLHYSKRDSSDAFKAVATRTSTYYKNNRFDKNEY